MRSKLSGMEGWEIVQELKNWLELVQLLHNIILQKDGINHFILELVEAGRNIMLCFQQNTMLVDKYRMEFKSCVEVCESVGMSHG